MQTTQLYSRYCIQQLIILLLFLYCLLYSLLLKYLVTVQNTTFISSEITRENNYAFAKLEPYLGKFVCSADNRLRTTNCVKLTVA